MGKAKLRGYTEKKAIKNGMGREIDLNQNTTHCPECGCPWYGNKNLCGDGHRVCCDCLQDWYVDVDYGDIADLRELPVN